MTARQAIAIGLVAYAVALVACACVAGVIRRAAERDLG